MARPFTSLFRLPVIGKRLGDKMCVFINSWLKKKIYWTFGAGGLNAVIGGSLHCYGVGILWVIVWCWV